MSFNIAINSQEILDNLAFFGEMRQGPFILSRTLNELAKRVQTNLRKDLTSSLNLRRSSWIQNQVKINSGTWSTKKRLHVTIQLTDPASFITDFEEGAEHVPFAGHTFLALPNKGVFGNRILRDDDELKPSNLNFKEHMGQTLGDRRTFIVNKNGSKSPLILQRIDSKAGSKRGRQKGVSSYSSMSSKTGLRLLFTLIKNANRPAKIHWYDTADRTVIYESEGIWSDVINKALADTK